MPGIGALFTQTVTVETYLGAGTTGPRYATAQTVACYVEDGNRLVRNSAGEEVVSSTRVFAPLATAPTSPASAGQFAPGSRVTVNGRTTEVISVARRDGAGPTRVHHMQAELA